ncbi:hypothetical protein TNCV_2627171 [Trichonephila clavipes]|uniref:Uncharacterized protein n=1 Tax=Trichonephila clavipes TaxID=2585209 RepID=A0A8X6W7P9_TRICX|nr:hypothetical protein TNCV_2627171 [Trichonephila clavipes]
MWTKSHHRTWNPKPRLLDENRENRSLCETDKPNEGSGQMNMETCIYCPNTSRPQDTLLSYSTSPGVGPMRTKTCTMVHQNIFGLLCITTSMLHIQGDGLNPVDLFNPLDFSSWGNLKSLVNETPMATMEYLSSRSFR